MGAFLGLLPAPTLRFIVKNSVGKSWSSSAIEALCTHVLKVELMFFLIYVVVFLDSFRLLINFIFQYHTLRNVLFMAMTEFEKVNYFTFLLQTPQIERNCINFCNVYPTST